MKRTLVVLFLVGVVSSVRVEPAETQDIIEAVNSAQTSWKAGRNFHRSTSKSKVVRMLGHRKRHGESVLPTQRYGKVLQDIPATYDVREQWPECNVSLSHISDQSDCGSCWAVSAADVFTDRMCIASKAQFTERLSACEVLTCCSRCGDGCLGGYDDQAWHFFKYHGIVTGGDYDSGDGCQPYPLQPCEHHINGSRIPCSDMNDPPTPDCLGSCSNANYSVKYWKDHHRTKKSYIVESTVEAMQLELFKYGPIQAGFTVYEDFLSYRTGVYQHVTGAPLGGHAVRVLGWGVEDGTAYWLVANSWNTDWGDQGYFKIKRGNDECGFESEVSAGIPLVPKH